MDNLTQKLLPAYDKDMAHPLINGIEYPYSITDAENKLIAAGVKFMAGYGLSDHIRAINREKRERLTRYNFLPMKHTNEIQTIADFYDIRDFAPDDHRVLRKAWKIVHRQHYTENLEPRIFIMRKSTNKELVEVLEARNENGRYDQLIANAKNNRYHDFKNPEDVVCGKMEVCHDMMEFPELADVRQTIINGEYDEEMDEEDKAQMRSEVSPAMARILGL
jgi:hypothetical protein